MSLLCTRFMRFQLDTASQGPLGERVTATSRLTATPLSVGPAAGAADRGGYHSKKYPGSGLKASDKMCGARSWRTLRALCFCPLQLEMPAEALEDTVMKHLGDYYFSDSVSNVGQVRRLRKNRPVFDIFKLP